jgi:hypothetical protein
VVFRIKLGNISSEFEIILVVEIQVSLKLVYKGTSCSSFWQSYRMWEDKICMKSEVILDRFL